jgi:hypothetical protein
MSGDQLEIEVASAARQMSIEFGKWICDREYEPLRNDRWDNGGSYTTEELYNEFILQFYLKNL